MNIILHKKLFIIIPIIIIIAAGVWFWRQSQIAPGYYGLPVVACIDPTQPVKQDFQINIKITINGKNVPLDANIGHDPGQCLRVIYTNDQSGIVYIKSNANTNYTLEDFFNVWHKVLTNNEIDGYLSGNGHKISVYINGLPVNTIADTPLDHGSSIEIIYQ